LVTLADPELAAARAAAEALAGEAIDSIERAAILGRNSNIFSVRQGARCFALKRYPSTAEDPRERLETELSALELMTRHGIRNVPQPIAGDVARGYALLEWVDGEAVTMPIASDVDAAIGFLAAIDCLRLVEEARLQPLASEACLSGAEVVAQIERRLSRLDAISKSEPELHSLIEDELRPLLAIFAAGAEAGYAAAKMAFTAAISPENRTLCPSDFGFHNSLRTPDGTLCFIDFDYFGWDDPVKLVADFLLHPGMNLSDALKRQFFIGASDLYGRDTEFGVRFRLLFPLFGLRWCMILLNEFLPERWSIRRRVGEQSGWGEVKQRQLTRVCQFVQMLKTEPAFFP
jgi:hypothetical protein